MAAFIVRAVEGEPIVNYCDSGIPFPDVTYDMWSCSYIKRLKELGIIRGYSNGTYGRMILYRESRWQHSLQGHFWEWSNVRVRGHTCLLTY